MLIAYRLLPIAYRLSPIAYRFPFYAVVFRVALLAPETRFRPASLEA
jgi:hypothetical protein